MNIMPLFVFMVPKSAQGWPLIKSSALWPDGLSRLARSVTTVPRSPFAESLILSSALPTCSWLPVPAPPAKDVFSVRKTLFGS